MGFNSLCQRIPHRLVSKALHYGRGTVFSPPDSDYDMQYDWSVRIVERPLKSANERYVFIK